MVDRLAAFKAAQHCIKTKSKKTSKAYQTKKQANIKLTTPSSVLPCLKPHSLKASKP